ncbi:uncharacterized protein LOC132713327 [Ruditapes philippinarum]|uniref:uncharacterized protein LOC132713327 n=1 Tax=Ruditapes philippinarum TaxID=129788 RepID=UPI00295B4D1B|nr:uncharacterized protein LOC132713327 [Ruditapes philippinarum]
MVAMSWLTEILASLFGMIWFVNCQIDVKSSHFQLVRPEVRTLVTHGDNITYAFSITFNLSTAADDVSIVVNGSSLLVLDSSDLQKTNFTWQTPDGLAVETDGLNLAVEVIKESALHPVPELDIQFSTSYGSLNLQSMAGQIELHVADTAALGCLLRPIMYIFFFSEAALVHQTIILGEYVFMELPGVKISLPEPDYLDMKERSTIISSVRLPTIPLEASSLSVYMPRNISSPFKSASAPYGKYMFIILHYFFLTC